MATVGNPYDSPGYGARLIRKSDKPNAVSLTCRQLHDEAKILLYRYSEYDLRWQYEFTKWLGMVEGKRRDIVWGGSTELEKDVVQGTTQKPWSR